MVSPGGRCARLRVPSSFPIDAELNGRTVVGPTNSFEQVNFNFWAKLFQASDGHYLAEVAIDQEMSSLARLALIAWLVEAENFES